MVSPAAAEAYTPLTPIRICDTRPANPSNLTGDQARCNRVDGAGERLVLNAVLTINLGGKFTVPADATASTASNVNFKTGVSVPNLAEIGLGAAGQIWLVSNQSVDVVTDL